MADTKYNPKDPQSFIMKYNDGTLLSDVYAKIASLTDFFYPVGTIYETSNADFDPNKVWGGTWVKIKGRMLVGSGDSYIGSVGATGGAKTRTLAATIGACNNNSGAIGYIAENATPFQSARSATYVVTGTTVAASNWNHSTPVVDVTTNARAVSIMPPYQVVNIWKRTE